MNTLKNKLFAAGLLLASSSFVCNFLSATSLYNPRGVELCSSSWDAGVACSEMQIQGDKKLLENLIKESEERRSLLDVELGLIQAKIKREDELREELVGRLDAIKFAEREEDARKQDEIRKKQEEEDRKREEFRLSNPMTAPVLLSSLTEGLLERSDSDGEIYVSPDQDQIFIVIPETCFAMNTDGFIAEKPRYICQYNLIRLLPGGSETDLGWQDAKIVVDETGSYTNKAVFILGTTGRIKISVCIYDTETCQRGPVHTHKHTIRSQSWS